MRAERPALVVGKAPAGGSAQPRLAVTRSLGDAALQSQGVTWRPEVSLLELAELSPSLDPLILLVGTRPPASSRRLRGVAPPRRARALLIRLPRGARSPSRAFLPAGSDGLWDLWQYDEALEAVLVGGHDLSSQAGVEAANAALLEQTQRKGEDLLGEDTRSTPARALIAFPLSLPRHPPRRPPRAPPPVGNSTDDTTTVLVSLLPLPTAAAEPSPRRRTAAAARARALGEDDEEGWA